MQENKKIWRIYLDSQDDLVVLEKANWMKDNDRRWADDVEYDDKRKAMIAMYDLKNEIGIELTVLEKVERIKFRRQLSNERQAELTKKIRDVYK